MWTTGPEEVMAGGAMLLQCRPRSSDDSELPSRISIKSYLQRERVPLVHRHQRVREQTIKRTTFQKDAS